MNKSTVATLERYRRGLKLEMAGWTADEIAKEFGYADSKSWDRLKRNQKTASQQVSFTSSRPRLCRTSEAANKRYKDGMEMEAQGVPPETVAKLLGYAGLSDWEALKKRKIEKQFIEFYQIDEPEEKIIIKEEQIKANPILTIEQKVMAILGLSANDLYALLDLVMEIKAR